MLLTEEDAKTKWCPFARVIAGAIEGKGGTVSPPYNRFAALETGSHPNPVDARCIASECMAWRWSKFNQSNLNLPKELTPPPPRPDEGFCGLAGKVE